MDFHEWLSLIFTMGKLVPAGQTRSRRDLDTTAARNLRTEGISHGAHVQAPASRRTQATSRRRLGVLEKPL